ncbi:GUN4 domain-containing protein [Spirulina major]|uniref:GUN4 domain-containing protein n=1 Tax=Spirulina major TaxID=270636 RepID=UPI003CCC0AD5
MDQLWVHYSQGHFGFSVQKQIYQSLGGIRKSNAKVWNGFGDAVGWRKGSTWLYYKDLKFNTSSPVGHLPIGFADVWGRVWFGFFVLRFFGLGILLSRRDL